MLGLIILFPLFAAGTLLAYQFSSASRVKKRMQEALSPFEGLMAEVNCLRQSLQNNIELLSSQYIQGVHAARLRAIPLDELKKCAAGMRLQALKDIGVRSVADLQGWNEYRVSQVRGVGPKSANAIVQAVARFTAVTKATPIDHPALPFSGDIESHLMQALYRQHWFEMHVAQLSIAFAEQLRSHQRTRDEVATRTSFRRWLWKFGTNETIRHNLTRAQGMIGALEEEGSRSLRDKLSTSFNDCRAVYANRVPVESIVQDFLASLHFYDSWFTSRLGKSGEAPAAKPISQQALTNTAVGSNLAHVEFGRMVPGPPPKTTEESRTDFPAEADGTAHDVGFSFESDPALYRALHPVFTGYDDSAPMTHANGIDDESNEYRIERETTPVSQAEALVGPVEQLISVSIGSNLGQQPTGFALPIAQRAARSKNLRWLSRGTSIQIQDRTLPHGFIYVGKGINFEQHYALNPWLSAKAEGTKRPDVAGHYFSYPALSPEQRSRYLDWLAEGASSSVEPGFGMLYFYGLERRILDLIQGNIADPPTDELGELFEEIHRLGKLFQEKPGGITVTQCCMRLSDFALARTFDGASIPELPKAWLRTYELPFAMRYGLGCFMRDGNPVPMEWALRWAYVEPTIYLRTPATRCQQEFEAAFAAVYRKKCGDGLIVPTSQTKLKLVYKPGWPMHLEPALQHEFAGIPDVAALSASQHTLKGLIEESTAMIDEYSRYLRRNTAKAGTLEALLSLPLRLWPSAKRDLWHKFFTSVVDPMKPVTLESLLRELGYVGDPALAKISEVVANLNRVLVGFEPDIHTGARRPKPSEVVVLFPLASETDSDRATDEYKKASLTISLSACIALADGHASEEEAVAVEAMIASWQHLHIDLRTRLRAQYRLQVRQELSLTSFKSRFSSLTPDGRMQLALALSSLATVDGNIAAAEVKLLEQVYRSLGLESQLLYSHLHGESQRALPSEFPDVSISWKTSGYALDAARLAALRQETEQVSALLAGVFAEEETPIENPTQLMNRSRSVETHPQEELLPSLDSKHKRFVAALIQKPSWTRSELEAAAATMQIMLDGALERVNEAAFDLIGEPLTEGDDPIYVQQSILENAE
jgi:uncharacterized tellurite resistance protein B-like protein